MDKKDIIELLSRLADTTVSAYGRNCEVAVHDLDDMERSLVYIAGKITGRKPGAPITDLAYRMLKEHGDDAPDLLNYRSVTKTGRTLKCTTVFVRDEAGSIRACYCINQDITDFLSARAALDEFTLNDGRQTDTPQETFAESVDEMVESLVLECSSRVGQAPHVHEPRRARGPHARAASQGRVQVPWRGRDHRHHHGRVPLHGVQLPQGSKTAGQRAREIKEIP